MELPPASPTTVDIIYNKQYKISGTEESIRDTLWHVGFSEDMIDDIIAESKYLYTIIKT